MFLHLPLFVYLQFWPEEYWLSLLLGVLRHMYIEKKTVSECTRKNDEFKSLA